MEQSGVEEILTPPEVAALLKIHVNTVYRLAKEGIIPGYRVGRGLRFSKRDLLNISSYGKKTSVQARNVTQTKTIEN